MDKIWRIWDENWKYYKIIFPFDSEVYREDNIQFVRYCET
jgi:hypothetical protein